MGKGRFIRYSVNPAIYFNPFLSKKFYPAPPLNPAIFKMDPPPEKKKKKTKVKLNLLKGAEICKVSPKLDISAGPGLLLIFFLLPDFYKGLVGSAF